jgi:signal transduction histidine kinase
VTVAVHRSHLRAIEASIPILVGTAILVGIGAQDRLGPVTVPLALAAAASLAARQRFPGPTMLASTGLVVALFHIDPSAGAVAVVAPAAALYSLGVRRGRAQQALGAFVGVAAIIAADLAHPGRPTVGETILHVVLVAIPLLAAQVIRTHRANVALLVERLEAAERARVAESERRAEQERMCIARELHDVVAHTLTEVNVQAAAAAEHLGPGEARDALERIEGATHTAIAELRAILGVLRTTDTTEATRDPAPSIDDIPALVERARANGLEVRFEPAGCLSRPLPDTTSLAAYRIVQESLTNARRHAPGTPVTVHLEWTDQALSIAVGNGPSTNGKPAPPGVGIAGMIERAKAVGGNLVAGPTADGFVVRADLPTDPRP